MSVYFVIGLGVFGGVVCAFLDILKSITKEMRDNHAEVMGKLCNVDTTLSVHTSLLCEVDEIENFEE